MKNAIKFLIYASLSFSIISCSSINVQKEWSSRGYSNEEAKLIQPYYEQYYSTLVNAMGFGIDSALNVNDAKQRVRSIFCSCVKKLGNKCKEKPDETLNSDKILWEKGNGAEMALKQFTAFQEIGNIGPKSLAIDPAECN